jgi:serine/threonine protein kinase
MYIIIMIIIRLITILLIIIIIIIIKDIEYLYKIIHRDLKPQNIMLAENDRVLPLRIIDMGCFSFPCAHRHVFFLFSLRISDMGSALIVLSRVLSFVT